MSYSNRMMGAEAHPKTAVARPAPGTPLTTAAFDKHMGAYEEAIAAMFRSERMAVQRRVAELERRLDELERGK